MARRGTASAPAPARIAGPPAAPGSAAGGADVLAHAAIARAGRRMRAIPLRMWSTIVSPDCRGSRTSTPWPGAVAGRYCGAARRGKEVCSGTGRAGQRRSLASPTGPRRARRRRRGAATPGAAEHGPPLPVFAANFPARPGAPGRRGSRPRRTRRSPHASAHGPEAMEVGRARRGGLPTHRRIASQPWKFTAPGRDKPGACRRGREPTERAPSLVSRRHPREIGELTRTRTCPGPASRPVSHARSVLRRRPRTGTGDGGAGARCDGAPPRPRHASEPGPRWRTAQP